MNLYFAYGSNMWRKQMGDRCPDHRLVGFGVLKGYRWIISARGYANIASSAFDVVHGVVYELSDVDEKMLDRSEGVDSGSYRKEFLMVEVDESLRTCLVYVDPIEDEGLPGEEYIRRINDGIKDAGLPAEYVRSSIRTFVPEQ
jgi:gamma-glutamylcyclotransferase